MGWTKKVSDHKHDTPSTYAKAFGQVNKGDEWTCNCGTVFRVRRAALILDQKDGDYYGIDWEIIQHPGGGRLEK